MSRMRVIGVGALVMALGVGAVACSDDGGSDASNDRGTIEFSEAPPGSTDLGLCQTYSIDQVKGVLGGEETFKSLPPTAIGAEGDAVTGESCGWDRFEPNGDSAILRIEVRDYGTETEDLETQFAELEEGTLSAEPVEGLGDAAFSSVSDETSLLQVRSGQYLLTLASRATGSLEPVSLDTMVLFGTAGLDTLDG